MHLGVQYSENLKQIVTYMRVFEDVFEMKAGGNQRLSIELRTYDASKDKL